MPKHFQLFTSAAERKGRTRGHAKRVIATGTSGGTHALAALRHERRRCCRWQGLGILSRASRVCPKMSDE
jgi:hypothetical protein